MRERERERERERKRERLRVREREKVGGVTMKVPERIKRKNRI